MALGLMMAMWVTETADSTAEQGRGEGEARIWMPWRPELKPRIPARFLLLGGQQNVVHCMVVLPWPLECRTRI